MNVKGKTYAVATGNYYTSKAAVRILEKAGMPYDAILAALFMSFVSEPLLSSPGGGGYYWLIRMEEEGKFLISCSKLLKTFHLKIKTFSDSGDFGDVQQKFHIGKASAAVPGIPAGILPFIKKIRYSLTRVS